MSGEPIPPEVKKMSLYAWIGEDELGTFGYGIKQAQCPAGIIPMVSCRPGQISQTYITDQMTDLSKKYGKTIRLVRFTFEEVIAEINPS